MDEYTDVYDDSDITEDTTPADESSGDMEDTSDDNGGTPDIEDVLRDVLDDYFGHDESDQEGDEDIGQDTDSDVEADHGTETEETEEGSSEYSVDPEILSEINGTLHQHADYVSGIMSKFTVSGNSVMVSLDEGSSALLAETLENQVESMEKVDHMSGLMIMILFVLLFDLLHRFAKRIVKNLTRGDDDKNAADS